MALLGEDLEEEDSKRSARLITRPGGVVPFRTSSESTPQILIQWLLILLNSLLNLRHM